MSRKDNNIIKRKDGTFEAKYIKDIINLEGSRYEYEINILLYFLKNDISIKEIPITTIYETKKNETSHYRCIKDSLKIYKIIKNVKI